MWAPTDADDRQADLHEQGVTPFREHEPPVRERQVARMGEVAERLQVVANRTDSAARNMTE